MYSCCSDGRHTTAPGEVYTVDGTQYTLTGLRAHSNYRIELRAFNTFGASDALRLNVRTLGDSYYMSARYRNILVQLYVLCT